MNRLLLWAAVLGWFLNTFVPAHPATRLAKVDAEGVLSWQGDGAEVARFVKAPGQFPFSMPTGTKRTHNRIWPGRRPLRFAEWRAETDPQGRPMTISLNGQTAVEGLEVVSRAGGRYRALDLDFADIHPSHGAIEIRLSAPGGEAILQALEVTPASLGGPAP